MTAALVMVAGLGALGSTAAQASAGTPLRLGSAAAAGPPRVTGDRRVDTLLSEMTLDEKLTLLEGAQEAAATNQFTAGYLPGIPRLGIPSLRLADGPPGGRAGSRRPG